MSGGYLSDQSTYAPTWTCIQCNRDVDSYCQGYMDVSGAEICEDCLAVSADDVRIIITRIKDEVFFGITFEDDTFSYICRHRDMLLDEVISLGYTPINVNGFTNDTVTVKYENPIMRKLKGMRDIEQAAKNIGDSIAEELS